MLQVSDAQFKQQPQLDTLGNLGVVGKDCIRIVLQIAFHQDPKKRIPRKTTFTTSDVRPGRVAVRGAAGRAPAPLPLGPLLQRRRRCLRHAHLHLPHAQPGDVLPLR